MFSFLGQPIEVGKMYIYLKNDRTGSSTVRKLKMIGKCVEVGKRVKFERLHCEGLTYFQKFGIGEEDTIIDVLYDSSDVICEYTAKNREE